MKKKRKTRPYSSLGWRLDGNQSKRDESMARGEEWVVATLVGEDRRRRPKAMENSKHSSEG